MAEKLDLSYAFGLPPKKAVEYFEAKGYVFSFDWWEVWQEAHAQAFTVAKVTRMDILQDIRAAVDKSLKEGQTFREFRKELEPTLKAKGWWGRQKVTAPDGTEREVTLGSPWRLKNIYRTNTTVALARGRWQAYVQNADNQPYLELVNVEDARLRPLHKVLAGKVFHITDPIWDKFAPPIDWGCRCHLIAHSAEDAEALGLKIESSEGRLTTEMRVISEATGEMRPVTVYTDPKTGATVSTGPAWDYNPGKTGFEPDLAKYSPDIVKEYQEVVKSEGLAHRIPVKTNADIGKLLKVFDQENPGIFQMGFREFRVTNSSRYLMAASQGGRISVSSATSPSGLKPAQNLRSALQKIAQGKALDFKEEYSIESLWHELGHTRSKGWLPDFLVGEHGIAVMETLNQFVARHTYPEFLEKLGGKAAHHQEIIENGAGYRSMVRNFRALLKKAGVVETAALDVLKPLAIESLWNEIPLQIPEKLSGLMDKPELKEKVAKALRYIAVKDEAEFTRVLSKAFGEDG